MTILDGLRRFIADTTASNVTRADFDDGDYRLATVALLVHVANADANADGVIDPPERARLRAIIETRFGLDAAATTRLIERAEQSDREAVDFYHFTHVLKRALDDDGRHKIVAMMWDVVFADGVVTEFEENVVWRVAELLGVPTRDRVMLRQKAAEAPGPESPGPESPGPEPVPEGPWSSASKKT